jgi:hypothetical protein
MIDVFSISDSNTFIFAITRKQGKVNGKVTFWRFLIPRHVINYGWRLLLNEKPIHMKRRADTFQAMRISFSGNENRVSQNVFLASLIV